MKTLIFILTLIAFAQTTFLPINLLLIIIICRSYAYEETSNYYLSFYLGIILGILTSSNLGFWPLIFLINVKLAHIIRKLPLTASVFTVIPLSLFLITLSTYFESLVLGSKVNNVTLLLEALISLPIFVLIKAWEERFVVRPEIKLRMK